MANAAKSGSPSNSTSSPCDCCLQKISNKSISGIEQSSISSCFFLPRYETSNPMKLPPERLYHFLHMLYLRWLSCCYFCPDVWIDFARFEAQYSWERGKAVLESAVKAIPHSLLLRMACCDFLEEAHHVDDAKELYEKALNEFTEPLVWILYMQFERRQSGMKAAREVFSRGRKVLCDSLLYLAAGRGERRP